MQKCSVDKNTDALILHPQTIDKKTSENAKWIQRRNTYIDQKQYCPCFILHLFPEGEKWKKGVKAKWFMTTDWCAFMISKIMISYLVCLDYFWKWREIDHSIAKMMKIVFLSKSIKWFIFNSPNFVLFQTLTDMCRYYNCKNDDIVIEARTPENITKVRLERRKPLW